MEENFEAQKKRNKFLSQNSMKLHQWNCTTGWLINLLTLFIKCYNFLFNFLSDWSKFWIWYSLFSCYKSYLLLFILFWVFACQKWLFKDMLWKFRQHSTRPLWASNFLWRNFLRKNQENSEVPKWLKMEVAEKYTLFILVYSLKYPHLYQLLGIIWKIKV